MIKSESGYSRTSLNFLDLIESADSWWFDFIAKCIDESWPAPIHRRLSDKKLAALKAEGRLFQYARELSDDLSRVNELLHEDHEEAA